MSAKVSPGHINVGGFRQMGLERTLALRQPDQQLEESKRLLDQKTIGCFGQQIRLDQGAVKVDNEGKGRCWQAATALKRWLQLYRSLPLLLIGNF